MPKIDAVLSIEDRANLMNRAAEAAKPAFATTFLDRAQRPTGMLRAMDRDELVKWLTELESSIELVRKLVQHLRTEDGADQITLADADTAAHSAAKASQVLLRRCRLIVEHTKPVSADPAFNTLVNECLDKVQFVHDDACELAQL
ncbi:hypothetical protein [Maritalea porphyrae]|jgi:hypothetical protein|uniref:hypothetical protein n=1 Tax=Maritalea porphyrae TaxID=880732 RepID=UPI0022AF2AB0|nr:hypothetical protein [Maritalea porphyrae]MCZ4273111.1 hypothetical protein [Maritalea porphyrae]